MRTPRSLGWMLAIGTLIPMAAAAADVTAGPPTDLSVTVYRAPDREGGSIDLDDLQGFALISEKRTVHIPAGILENYSVCSAPNPHVLFLHPQFITFQCLV